MSAALSCVLDASVVIKLFIAEADSERADGLIAQLAVQPAEIHVPDLLYIECANIFWKYIRISPARFGGFAAVGVPGNRHGRFDG